MTIEQINSEAQAAGITVTFRATGDVNMPVDFSVADATDRREMGKINTWLGLPEVARWRTTMAALIAKFTAE
jgi:hypothetical protein